MLISILMASRLLVGADWDPTVFVAFGEDATAITHYAEESLGREVITRADQGHDGKFFFVQSNDPWLLDPDENIAVIDRPLYRSQRMLYPALAGGAGALSPHAILWMMLMVNLLAMGVGTWGVARIAGDLGMSPWWGLAFALNIGLMSEMFIDGGGVVAAAGAFWAVSMIMRDRFGGGVAVLALAALSREAMLLAAFGAGFWLWRTQRRWESALTVGVPIAAVLAWAFYLRLRIDWDVGVNEIQEIGIPFVGFIRSFEYWVDNPVSLAAGIAVMILFLLYLRRVLASRELIGWAFVGFIPLGLLFTQQVWQSYFDFTRAIAPIITSFVLLVFADRGQTLTSDIERTGVRPQS